MAAFIALAGANTIFAAGRDICVDAAKGDDAGGTGSSEAPFKTLQRAVSKLREINKNNKNDINVRIAPGDYFIDKEIHLDNSCGGGIYWHVNFIGNPKDMPRIIGGRKITEWENLGNGTFASRIGKGLKKFTLIENGKPAREASYPNSGYIQALDGGKNEKGESFVTIDPALLKDAGENMTIAIWPGCHNRVGSNYNWSQIRARPKSIDKSSGKIELAQKSHFLIWKGNRCRLYGAKSFLDDKGEFFYDPGEGVLYYIPLGGDISKSEIILSDLKTILRIAGKSADAPVRDIHFKHVEILGSAPLESVPSGESYYNAMVMLSNAEDVSFDSCKFLCSGTNSISARDWQENISVTNCLFKDCGHSAISAQGPWEDAKNWKNFRDAHIAKNWKISNNAIIRVGRVMGSSAGIVLGQVGDSTISNNLIKHAPRHGISMNSTAYPVMKDVRYSQKVTWENHVQSIFARNITVEFNEVVDAMNDSNDGGAISSWGSSGNNAIRNNLIRDMRGFYDHAHIIGIYLDDGSSDFLIENNIICRIRGSKICFPLQIKGINNRIINNVIADNDTTHFVEIIAAGLTGLPESRGKSEALIANHTYARNIFSADSAVAFFSVKPFGDEVFNVCDYNLYNIKSGEYNARFNYNKKPRADWKYSDGRPIDEHSIFGQDPMFENPAKTDYRVKEGSPALKLGFKNIDTSNIGLKKDFPFMGEIEE